MLVEPVLATVDVPAHDVSAMDGFAVAGAVSAGARLPVGGTVAAGDAPGAPLEPGVVLRIMTGAAIPFGADRIVPIEQTEPHGEDVEILAPPAAGAHIRRRGEVVHDGEPLLPAGAVLGPGALGLLATHGYREVTVHRRPRVAVLATGSEVVPPETEPGPGQLRDSHTDFLLAAGRTLDLDFVPLGIAADRRPEIRERVRRGLDFDVLLVGGGVSKGEFDYVEGILEELGCESLFDSVAVQPGKPLVAARHARGWVIGLPGNPASVMVCFWLFVRPLLRRLAGHPDGFWHGALSAELAGPLPGAKGRDRFLAAGVSFVDGRALVTPRPAKGSHDLSAYSQGSALVRVPARARPATAGQPCEILPLVPWPA